MKCQRRYTKRWEILCQPAAPEAKPLSETSLLLIPLTTKPHRALFPAKNFRRRPSQGHTGEAIATKFCATRGWWICKLAEARSADWS